MTELWIGFGLGAAGSLHCVAMCGPLMVAARRRAGGTAAAVAYQAGRIAIYAALGFAAGVGGQVIFVNGVGPWISIISGLALLAAIAGPLRTAVTPMSRRLGTSVGRGLTVAARRSSTGALRFALAAGALNALLPCGMVYVALTAAVATHDPWRALVFMLGFGAGTLPLLSVASATAMRALPRWSSRPRVRTIAMAAVALLLIGRGLFVVAAPSPDATALRDVHHRHAP